MKGVIAVTDFTGGPGLLAFIATFTVVIAAIWLFRSMGKHLRKARSADPESRRDDEPREEDGPA